MKLKDAFRFALSFCQRKTQLKEQKDMLVLLTVRFAAADECIETIFKFLKAVSHIAMFSRQQNSCDSIVILICEVVWNC